jgi:hypothetical protein
MWRFGWNFPSNASEEINVRCVAHFELGIGVEE